MILLVATALAVGGFFTIRTLQSSLTRQMGGNFEVHSTNVGDLVVRFFSEHVGHLRVLSQSPTVRDQVTAQNASYSGDANSIIAEIESLDDEWVGSDDGAPLIATTTSSDRGVNPSGHRFSDFLGEFGHHTEVFVTDGYGATVAATGRLSDYYQADEGWWQAGWDNGRGAIYISDPEFDESAGVTAMLIAVPVRDADTEEVIGILRSTLNVNALFALVSVIRFGDTGKATLLDKSGQDLASFGVQTVDDDAVVTAVGTLLDSDSEASYQIIEPGSERMIVGYSAITASDETDTGVAINSLGWTALVQQEAGEALSSVNAFLIAGLWTAMGTIIIAISSVGGDC